MCVHTCIRMNLTQDTTTNSRRGCTHSSFMYVAVYNLRQESHDEQMKQLKEQTDKQRKIWELRCFIPACMHLYMYACVQACMNVWRKARQLSLRCIFWQMPVHMYAYMHAHIHVHMHASYMHAHMHSVCIWRRSQAINSFFNPSLSHADHLQRSHSCE